MMMKMMMMMMMMMVMMMVMIMVMVRMMPSQIKKSEKKNTSRRVPGIGVYALPWEGRWWRGRTGGVVVMVVERGKNQQT